MISAPQALPSQASTSQQQLPAPNKAPSFNDVAAHCFKIAENYSQSVVSQASDYDGDSMGGAIGAGLALGIERKKLRKKIYTQCMDANGFPNAKYLKSKSKT